MQLKSFDYVKDMIRGWIKDVQDIIDEENGARTGKELVSMCKATSHISSTSWKDTPHLIGMITAALEWEYDST